MRTLLIYLSLLPSSLHAHEVTFEIVSSAVENTVTFSNDKSDRTTSYTTGHLVAEVSLDETRTQVTSFHFTGGTYTGSPYDLTFDFGKKPFSLIFQVGPTEIHTRPFTPTVIQGSGIDFHSGRLNAQSHYWYANQGKIKSSLGKLRQVVKDYEKDPECQLFQGQLEVAVQTRSLDAVSDLVTLTLSNTVDSTWEHEISKSYGPDDPGLTVSTTSRGRILAIGTLLLPKVSPFPNKSNNLKEAAKNER